MYLVDQLLSFVLALPIGLLQLLLIVIILILIPIILNTWNELFVAREFMQCACCFINLACSTRFCSFNINITLSAQSPLLFIFQFVWLLCHITPVASQSDFIPSLRSPLRCCYAKLRWLTPTGQRCLNIWKSSSYQKFTPWHLCDGPPIEQDLSNESSEVCAVIYQDIAQTLADIVSTFCAAVLHCIPCLPKLSVAILHLFLGPNTPFHLR